MSTKCSFTPVGNELSVDVISLDYTDLFLTNSWFATKEDLVDWVRGVALANQMIIVVKRSDNGGGTKKGRIVIVCERSGEHRAEKVNKLNRADSESGEKTVGVKQTGSRKCGCPFLLKGKQVEVMGLWALEVVNAVHNHSIAKYLQGHPYAARFTKEEEEFVIQLSLNRTRPKDLMKQLWEKYPTNVSSHKCNT